MSVTTATRQKVLGIRQLIDEGYKDKQICMILHVNKSYVSRVKNGRINSKIQLKKNEIFNFTLEQKQRKKAIDIILGMPDLITTGKENETDIMYIHVLKFFLVDKQDVYKLYFFLSKTHFSKLWAKKDIDIRYFHSECLGIDRKIYLDLIIDYFL